MKSKYFPPELGKAEYHCPHCNVYAKQFWAHISAINEFQWSSFVDNCSRFRGSFPGEWSVSKCQHCGKLMIWYKANIVYPKKLFVPNPNSDLTQEIQEDYIEAANIFNDSPRASAAILRLALQKLCKQLGGKGDNINEDIKSFVKKGLNPLVQKSLDSLRITGNNAVHPGLINLKEEKEKVLKLFDLINFIANKMITEPKEISKFYDGLPESSKKAIKKRDNKSENG